MNKRRSKSSWMRSWKKGLAIKIVKNRHCPVAKSRDMSSCSFAFHFLCHRRFSTQRGDSLPASLTTPVQSRIENHCDSKLLLSALRVLKAMIIVNFGFWKLIFPSKSDLSPAPVQHRLSGLVIWMQYFLLWIWGANSDLSTLTSINVAHFGPITPNTQWVWAIAIF